MKQPLESLPITVIIPVYKVSMFDFWQCLNSITKQTRKPRFVIIIDDGNEDTIMIQRVIRMFIEDIGDRMMTLKFIQNPNNLGISCARNIGLTQVTTPWVSFLDADDCIKETYFQRLYEEVEKNDNVDIVACSCYAYDEHEYRQNHFFKQNRVFEGATLKELEKSFINQSYLREGTSIDTAIGVPWGKLYRFSCIRGIYFNPELKRMEDNIWNHEILLANPNIVVKYIDEPLYIYRTTHITKYNAEFESDVSTWFKIIDLRKELIKEHLGTGDQIEKFFYEEVVRLLVLTLQKKYFHKENQNRAIDFLELKVYLNNETIREALRRTCTNTPFYRNVMNKLLLKRKVELAYLINRLRGR